MGFSARKRSCGLTRKTKPTERAAVRGSAEFLSPNGERKMKSSVLPNHAAPQISLRLVHVRQNVDPALVVAQPSFLGAIKLCISLAGFDADKQVYRELDIDAGHWSRILRGEAHFPVDKLT